MSETSTIPISNEKMDRAREAANYLRGNEFHVPRYPEAETIDLGGEDTLNENLWTAEELETPVKAIERLEAVPQKKTRAQEIEESLFYLNDKQLLDYARANTVVVPMMRKQSRGDFTLAA